MRRLAGVVVCAVLVGSFPAAVPLDGAEPATLIPFELEDQFDRAHSDRDLRDRVVVVFGSDRKGSRYNDRWVKPVQDLIGRGDRGGKILIVEIADLRGVPFFVRGGVKKKFPRGSENAVLMDWKGRFAKSYGFAAGVCNILVFDRRGNLVHRIAVEEQDPGTLAVLRRELESLAAPSAPGLE